VFRADVVHGIPNGGHLILTPDYLCFYSRRIFRSKSGIRTKIPIIDIKDAHPGHAFRWHHYGIQVVLDAHADIAFELHSREDRDKLELLIKTAIQASKIPSEDKIKHIMPPPCTTKLEEMLNQDILIPQDTLHKVSVMLIATGIALLIDCINSCAI
jgi:hypothetical protein